MARILIAEDEAHILRVMAMWLARHGHEILEAADGAAALDLLDSRGADLMISDMNMPRVDGVALIHAVRHERGLSIPLVLLTARCDLAELARRFAGEGVHLLPKPFVPSRLVAQIDRLLAGRTQPADTHPQCGEAMTRAAGDDAARHGSCRTDKHSSRDDGGPAFSVGPTLNPVESVQVMSAQGKGSHT